MQNCQREGDVVVKTIFPGRSRSYRILTIKLFIILSTLLSAVSNLYAESFQEYQVKAVFLYNLTNFVSWPTGTFDKPKSPFKICILGEDPFGVFLDKVVQRERVNGKEIVIDRLADIKDLHQYHILFISRSMKRQLPRILKATRDCNVLTVGDVEGFSRLGGIINLICKNNRVYVEINLNSAKKADLGISSKLLHLARIVNGED